MLKISSFSARERVLPPLTEISMLIFWLKHYNEAFRAVCFKRIGETTLNFNVFLVLKSKALWQLLDEADYDLKNCADHGGCYLQPRQKTPSESCIIYFSVDIKAKSINRLIVHAK